ncbi:MAG: WD40 repeat domain-containing protein [Armatimonadota bacterium]|nr:WD40 repeat domain-containing protein [Armatimonadota bacterium]
MTIKRLCLVGFLVFPLVILYMALAYNEQAVKGVKAVDPRQPLYRHIVIQPSPMSQNEPELVLQYAHTDYPLDVSFAVKAPIFAANDGNGHIDIWNTRTQTLERVIDTGVKESRRNYITRAIALSPSGKTLAYLTNDGEAQIWDTSSGKLLKKLPKPLGELPVSVTWSADGLKVAAGSTTSVRVWIVESGKTLRTFPAAGDVAFSKDGRILGIASESGASLFDITTGRKIRSFHDKAGVSWPIAISPDGRYVATGGEDPSWDPGPLPQDEDGNEYPPTESFYSHELKVKIWDRRTGRRLRLLPGHNNLDGGTKTLQFTSDSRRLFSSGDSYTALWDIRSGKKVKDINGYGSISLSPDGKYLLKPHMPPLPIRSIAFSPDGKILAAGDETDGSTGLRLWDIGSGQLALALQGPPPNLHSVSFISNHKVLSNSLNGGYIWDASTGKILTKHRGLTEELFSGWALLTPDGSKIVNESMGGFQKSFAVLDAVTGKSITTLPTGHTGSLNNVSFSPDGRYLANENSRDSTVTIWNLDTGRKVSELDNIGRGGAYLFFSHDGKTMAGSLPGLVRMPDNKQMTDNRLILWDTNSGNTKKQIILSEKPARVLAFTPDGRTLAAGIGADIHLYDTKTLHDNGSLSAGKSPITALAYSPDGSRIAAGHEDGIIQIWDVEPYKLLITMLGFTSADGKNISQDWIAYTPDGFYDWSPGATKLIRWRYKGKLYPASAFTQKLQQDKLLK